MSKQIRKLAALLLATVFMVTGLASVSVSAKVSEKKQKKYEKAKDLAVEALIDRLESERERVYVYKDFAVTENHYTQRAKMYEKDESLVLDMDENWQTDPYEGSSCIRCEQILKAYEWGGWIMMNGYLPKGETVPRLNTGNKEGQGLDLTGADALHFYAKGSKGGEVVKFFTCGFAGNVKGENADSAEKQETEWIELADEWQEYVIPLKGLDLSSITIGFGYVLSDTRSGLGTTVFYLDNIYFSGNIKSAQNAPVLLRSYDTENIYIKNAAFSYDNALVALAFISEGKKKEAKEILDAFIYAIDNDRAYLYGKSDTRQKRLRNAYAAGDISPFPGWECGTRLPGWYSDTTSEYYEDQYQVGSNCGNTAYVALAFIQYYNAYGGKKYLKAACTLMDWVIDNCSDDGYGFNAGFDGWEEAEPQVVYKYTYKSSEHNIDCYSAFNCLYKLTGKKRYKKAMKSSLKFLESMYDKEKGVFYAGTGNDGKTPNKDVIVLDAQVWSALALGDKFKPYEDSLKVVKSMRTKDGAYPFYEGDKTGAWYEGTAFTALMLYERGDTKGYQKAMDALVSAQDKGGLFPAASEDNLFTGMYLFTGDPWVYSTDLHIAPTAHFIMAVNGFNWYVID